MCCGSCGVPYMALSSKGAVINGIIQMAAGVVAVISGISFSVLPSGNRIFSSLSFVSGTWCGPFFIIGGILMLIAGWRHNFGCTIAALVLAFINIGFSFKFFILVINDYTMKELIFGCGLWDGLKPFEDCSDGDYRIAVFILAALILTAFAEIFSVIWALVIICQALCRGGCSGGAKATTTPEVHMNVKAQNPSLRFNWISQLASTIISAIATVIILFIVAYGVQSGKHDRRILYHQKLAMSLWCAPVYLVAAFCGFRAWRFGENSSLISFLVLNILQLPSCLSELGISALVVSHRFDIEIGFAIVNKYVLADNAYRFQPALIVFHTIVIISASLHFCFAIWGIIASAIAIHQDNACGRCCVGCCCADDDHDHTEIVYVGSSASVPIVSNEVVADVVDHPPNYLETVNTNRV